MSDDDQSPTPHPQPPTPGAPWSNYRVGHGVLIEDGALLLVANEWYPGQPPVWSLPGGRCEEGEPAIEAVVREFREETGLVVETGPLAYVAETHSLIRRQHFLVCAFVMRRLGGTLAWQDDATVREARFVPLGELDRFLPHDLGTPVQYWLAHPGAPLRYWYFPEYVTE